MEDGFSKFLKSLLLAPFIGLIVLIIGLTLVFPLFVAWFTVQLFKADGTEKWIKNTYILGVIGQIFFVACFFVAEISEIYLAVFLIPTLLVCIHCAVSGFSFNAKNRRKRKQEKMEVRRQRETELVEMRPQQTASNGGSLNKTTALLLSIFLGNCGIDRFYLGYVGMGLFKFFTMGGFGILYLVDIINIARGTLVPKDGNGYREN